VTVSFIDPRVQLGAGRVGSLPAAVATADIDAGEIVIAFGGRCVPREAQDTTHRALQIEERLFLQGDDGVADAVLHSCDPSCVVSSSTVLVAARDLRAGDTITYDYATTQGTDDDEFECSCGTAMCRGKVTGHDWMLPELQLRYRGNFSPYLARRISGLQRVGAERRAFAL
jgi:uncharacterized protein